MKLELSKLQYVLFDWDNTLAETRTALVTVVNQVLDGYGMPSLDESNGEYDKNLSFRDNFPNIFGEKKHDEAYQRYASLYKQQIKNLISTFPCVQQTLDFFAAHKIPMIVLTNKDRNLLNFELPLLFDSKIFTRIVAGHEASKDKPYPEQAWYALDGLLKPQEFTPEKVWIIGDSDMDSDCALAAGARAIRIGHPIWNDVSELDERVFFFEDFCSFLKTLQTTL